MAASGEIKSYTLAEVGEHKHPTGPHADVWIVIHDKVYNVTKFLDEHPGGEEIILENAGEDCSEAFEDASHSNDAKEMLKDFFIGHLAEADRKVKQTEKSGIGLSNLATVLVPAVVFLTAFIVFKVYSKK